MKSFIVLLVPVAALLFGILLSAEVPAGLSPQEKFELQSNFTEVQAAIASVNAAQANLNAAQADLNSAQDRVHIWQRELETAKSKQQQSLLDYQAAFAKAKTKAGCELTDKFDCQPPTKEKESPAPKDNKK